MRFLLFTCLTFFVVFSSLAQKEKQLINFDWKFSKGEFSGVQNASFDDSGWQIVQLPHDASISGPFVQDSLGSSRTNGFLPRQKGWYRKVLHIDNEIGDNKVFLEFEGVYRDAHVYVNGTEVAHQLNGFEGFLVDVTQVVQEGKNLIAVSYDNTDKESSRWYNGEGIYRNVWLLITNPVHVTYNGIFIHTPFITDELAVVNIETDIINESSEEMEISVISELVSPDGKCLDSIINIVPLIPGERFIYKQKMKVKNPVRWDLASPNLYQVVTKVKTGDKLLDESKTNFGIRTLEFHRDHGFLLNGKKILAKGVNIHHDLGPLGAAAFDRGFERRLEGLKKLGCNAIRLSHNPHSKFILDWCDRNGMLVLDEAFDKWDDQFFGKGNSFDDHWKASLESFVKRDRNHPSIFLWSVGNETRQQKSQKPDYGTVQLKKMMDFLRVLDPGRKVTCGLHPSRKSGAYRTENYYREGPPEMVFYMDVVSTNYREEFWPIDRANYPQLIFILSEAQVGNLGNEWFNFNHDTSVGLFYWGGTDYIGESFGWPSKGWPNGIIDWNDHWKPFSYYIQSLYSEMPVAHVTTFDPKRERSKHWNEVQLRYLPMFDHWNWEGSDSVDVFTFSNGQEVELFLNGKSLGTKQVPEEYYTKDIKSYSAEEYDPDNPINTGPEIHKRLAWKVPFEPGVLKVISRIDGKEVASHELKTAGKARKIVLEADRDKIKANGLDLSYVSVKVTDADGLIVPTADQQITFSVDGAGTNAGVSSADLISDESFVSDHRRVFEGKALLVVRSKREAGEITINAKAKGLKSAKIVLEAD